MRMLGRGVGRGGFFALAFGAMVGSGWVIVLGDWLKAAGPAGITLGFLVGGALVMAIGLCYGELATRFPTAGGEFLYALNVLGRGPAFLVAWFLMLSYVAVCAFEAIACAWLVSEIYPGVVSRTLYTLFNKPVTLDALVIGVLAALCIGWLHSRGARSTIGFQNVITGGFIAVSLLLMVAGTAFGSADHLQPLFETRSGRHWLLGALWIFAISAFFLNGWQSALHAIEEREAHAAPRTAVLSMVVAIFAAALFYIGITLSAAHSVPWISLIGADLPAVAAFSALGFHGALGTVILVAALASLLKTWSATTWEASRIMFAQARYGLLPQRLADVDSASGTPRSAIVAVTALSIAGLALGRGAIEPIVNMGAICAAFMMIVSLLVLIRCRARVPSNSFTVPGGTATIYVALAGACVMVGIAVIQPLFESHGLPIEWYLLIAWGLFGVGVWVSTRGVRAVQSPVSEER